jgi:hypothetical protein
VSPTRQWLLGVVAIWTFLDPCLAQPYEVRTHAEITTRAFLGSARLSAYMIDAAVDSARIFDAAHITPFQNPAGFVNTGVPRDWMSEGAIREDDFDEHPLLEALGCDGPANPPSAIDRPLNHFFDIQRGGSGLMVPLVTGLPAPDWALGLQGRGPSPTQNQFSLPDARVYQFRSLTDPDAVSRERNAALLFRTLGHVLHLLQDMGQPQHTRNDPHLGCLPSVLVGERSWYEAYVETRTLGTKFRARGVMSPPLFGDGYFIDTDPSYPVLFRGPTSLAAFSSRNFFSAGTNLNTCLGLPQPVCNPDAYDRQVVQFSVPAVGNTVVSGVVTMYHRDAFDAMVGATLPAIPVSTRSLWDQHLESRGLFPTYSLNTLNYDAMADTLLPRAVGYSVALLDRFFRARLNVRVEGFVDTRVPGRKLQLWISNGTPGESLGPGAVELLYDRPGGQRVSVGSWPLALGPGEESATPIEIPGMLVDQDLPGRFLLVYHGFVGTEPDAIAARWFDASVTYLDLQYITFLGVDQAVAYGFNEEVYATPTEFGMEVSTGRELTHQGEVSRAIYAYRPPSLLGGVQATAHLHGWCSDDAGGLPVTAEIVEGAGPFDVETLMSYRWASPPPVKRVLSSFTVPFGEEVEDLQVPLDLTGVRLLGVRLVSQPTPPGTWSHICWAGASIRLPR